MKQIFVMAIAEKVSAPKTEADLRERRQRGEPAGMKAWLAATPDAPPMPGNETLPQQ